MKLKKKEVKETKNKKKRKLNIQKIFNLVSFMFILACCIFYGGRLLKLHLENNHTEETKLLADYNIPWDLDNKQLELFTRKIKEYKIFDFKKHI